MPSRQLTLDLIQIQLRRVGVEVEVIYAPQSSLFNQLLTSGAFDAVLFSWSFDPGGAPMPESILRGP